VLIALLLSSIAASPAVDRFHAQFPAAHQIASLDGQRLVHASGFAVATGSGVPEVAARAFLSVHGAAFGVTNRQLLVVESAPAPGVVGAVKFRRTIDGFPVFNGNLSVGVDALGRVFVVNGADVPATITGRRALSDASAMRLAAGSFPRGLKGAGPMTVTAGWRRSGSVLRPAYRVDFMARDPAGDWRTFVDAETGAILFREDLRRFVDVEGTVYQVSPSQSATGLCPLVGNVHPPCASANPSTVTFTNLTTGADLTGTQTTVFNCKGADGPATAADVTTGCGKPVAAVNNTFDFTPDTTFPDTDVNDDFSAAMAYFHLDKHVSMFKKLDPTTLPPPFPPGTGPQALRDSVPALVNVRCGPNIDPVNCTTLQPFDNAFFSGGLNAMVFGQGTSADFAYDATVAYHEFTHGVIFAWGDFNIDIDSLGGLDEPGAVNEGTADTMASAETQRPEIGSFITSVDADPNFRAPFLRNMNDPAASRTCQGNGAQFGRFFSNDITGLDGEVHDDGEIWNGLTWEVFQGLKAAGFKGCNGACEAEPALQYKTIQFSGGSSPTLQSQWLTLKSAATALFPANPEVTNYVDCVGKRRGFDKCDRTFALYQGDVKSQFIRLRFGTFQFVVNAAQAGSSISICSRLGTSATVWARKGQPVEVTLPFNQNTGAATAIVADQSFPITHDCRSTPPTTSFALPSAGTWYLLIEAPNAFPGANPGVDAFGLLPGVGFSTRPPSTPPPICDTPSNLAISASAASIPPRGHLTFTPSAGSGTGYTWSIATNASGGTIDAATGAYTAGPNPNVTDIVELNDSTGNIRTKSITVGPGVTVDPPTTTLARKAKVTFKATGGSGTGFSWSLVTNASGGTINSSSGQYQAGGTPNVVDVVRAVDSLGNASTANVNINNAPPADEGGGCATGGGPEAMALLAGIAALLKQRRSSGR